MHGMAFTIRYTPEFRRDYRKLPTRVRERVKERGALFTEDPFHPLLRTHKLGGKLAGTWAFAVDSRHRVLFEFLEEGVVLLLRVGDHSIYRKH